MGNRIKYKIKTGRRTANDRFMIVIAVRSLFFRVYVNELMCIFRIIRINFPHHFQAITAAISSAMGKEIQMPAGPIKRERIHPRGTMITSWRRREMIREGRPCPRASKTPAAMKATEEIKNWGRSCAGLLSHTASAPDLHQKYAESGRERKWMQLFR